MSFNLFFSPRLFPSFFYYVIDALFLTLFLSSTICGPYSCKVWFLFRSWVFLVVFFGKIKLLVIFTRFWYMCMWDLLGSYGFWTGILLTILLGVWGLFGEEIFVVLFCRLTVSDWYMYGYKSSLSSHMQLSKKRTFYRIMTTQYTSIDVWWHHRYLLKNDKVWEDSICLLSVLTT